GIGAGVGALWHPCRVLSLGAVWESFPDPIDAASQEARLGVGMDLGISFGARPDKHSPSASMTRASVEYFLTPGESEPAEWRFGFGLRFHPLLSIHAGFTPRHQSAALGVRFGMGDWEG